jgi:hypothetical protein
MLEEIQDTLSSIAEFFRGGSSSYSPSSQLMILISTAFVDHDSTSNKETDVLTRLPEIIQKYKIGIEDKKQKASLSSHRVAELIDKINQVSHVACLNTTSQID